jgi:hypothetical protein
MKKILLLLFVAIFTLYNLAGQQCNCGSVKFVIGQWKCQGKNASGFPVYYGVLNIGNGPGCVFKLLEIVQQVAGDVIITLPVTVAANAIVNVPITFTDHPPFIAAGASASFTLVYTRGTTKCRQVIRSAILPKCIDSACKCNPSGWQNFTAKIKNRQSTVKCGNQFSLTCADTIMLKGLYKCSGNCGAKYVAVLKNTVTNTVVQNFSPFTFPWSYRFTTAGSYSLEITPLCGDNKCTPCRFFFTVTCQTACDCNPEGWSNFDLITVTGLKTVIKCGEKVPVKKGSSIKLSGKYTCKGKCVTKYIAVLKNNTGTVVQNYPAFTFPYSHAFAAAGVYQLEIVPICGTKKCPPCVIFFVVE